MRLLVGCLGIALLPLPTQSAGNNFAEEIARIEQRTATRIGVVALDGRSNRRLQYRENERFPMCSTFKLLAVAAVLQRVDGSKEDLGRFVTYTQRDILAYAPVTKEHLAEGGMNLSALCEAAIEQSDNTAGNLLLQTIGGPSGVTDFARSIGDSVTRLDRSEPDLNSFRAGDDRDTTTPAAMCADLVRLFTTDALSGESRAKLERWLKLNQTGAELIRDGVPNDWQIGDKTGRSMEGATNDIGILYPPDGSRIFTAIYSIGKQTVSENGETPVASVTREVIKMFGLNSATNK